MFSKRASLALAAFVVAGSFIPGAVASPARPKVQSNAPAGFHLQWSKGHALKATPFSGTAPALTPSSADELSACNVLLGTPTKSGSSIVAGGSMVCTTDVYFVAGTMDLFRGLSSPTLIGADPEHQDTNALGWSVSGNCASSTWAYWDEVPSAEACSEVNGCAFGGPFVSNYHYWSC